MIALVYRFDQNGEGPRQLTYLKKYQEVLVKAKISFEKLNDLEGGILLIYDFLNSHSPPISLKKFAPNLAHILKENFLNRYLLVRTDCEELIRSGFKENKENEDRLSNLMSFYDSFPDDSKLSVVLFSEKSLKSTVTYHI